MHNKIILVIGPKGSGKTETTAGLLPQFKRRAVFDLVQEKAYERDEPEIVIGNPYALYSKMDKSKESFSIVYRPTTIKVLDNGLVNSADFEPFVKLCFLRGDMCMVIDEAHLLCNSRNCPSMLMVSNLVGRHRELDMILIAQSFSGIHPAIRKNADEFYFWKIIEPSDLDGIKERCGVEVMQQVKGLRAIEVTKEGTFVRAGQHLHWTKFGGVEEITK